jgi:hypothetical protein
MARSTQHFDKTPEFRGFLAADFEVSNRSVYLVEKMPDRGFPFVGKSLYTARRRKHGA